MKGSRPPRDLSETDLSDLSESGPTGLRESGLSASGPSASDLSESDLSGSGADAARARNASDRVNAAVPGSRAARRIGMIAAARSEASAVALWTRSEGKARRKREPERVPVVVGDVEGGEIEIPIHHNAPSPIDRRRIRGSLSQRSTTITKMIWKSKRFAGTSGRATAMLALAAMRNVTERVGGMSPPNRTGDHVHLAVRLATRPAATSMKRWARITANAGPAFPPGWKPSTCSSTPISRIIRNRRVAAAADAGKAEDADDARPGGFRATMSTLRLRQFGAGSARLEMRSAPVPPASRLR